MARRISINLMVAEDENGTIDHDLDICAVKPEQARINVTMDQSMKKSIHSLAIEQGRTLQDIGLELFAGYLEQHQNG